jgi:hypothetical protein
MVGLLVAPVAVAQDNTAQQTPGPTPDPSGETKPGTPPAPAATMTPVTVTGARPSDDFAPPPVSIFDSVRPTYATSRSRSSSSTRR